MKPFIVIRAIPLPQADLQAAVDAVATGLRTDDYRLVSAYPEAGPTGPRLILIFQR